MTQPPSNQERPGWLKQARRFFPNAIFATLMSIAFAVVGFVLLRAAGEELRSERIGAPAAPHGEAGSAGRAIGDIGSP